VEGDVLGEEFKGYVFKIMGGQDKQVGIVSPGTNKGLCSSLEQKLSLEHIPTSVQDHGRTGQAGRSAWQQEDLMQLYRCRVRAVAVSSAGHSMGSHRWAIGA